MKVRIVHLEGSRTGQTQELPGPVLAMGRDPSCHVAFDPVKDERVSGRHATLTIQGQNLVLMDTGSKNGTFVNGQKISQPLLLPPNAVIQLGDNGPKIMVQVVADTGPPPPPAGGPPPSKPTTAAVPAPAEPAKSGGGGAGKCILFGCLFTFLLVLCLVAGYVGYLMKYGNRVEKDPPPPVTNPDKPGDPAPPPPPPPVAEKKASAWSKLPIGTLLETKADNEMKTPATKSETITKYVVKERDAENTIVEVETLTKANGMDIPPQIRTDKYPNVEQPADAPPADPKAPKPTVTKEALEVAGLGKVDCEKSTVRETAFGLEKSRTEVWMDVKKDLPFPVKTTYQTPLMKSSSAITKITKPK